MRCILNYDVVHFHSLITRGRIIIRATRQYGVFIDKNYIDILYQYP